jgi:hypothetical protein
MRSGLISLFIGVKPETIAPGAATRNSRSATIRRLSLAQAGSFAAASASSRGGYYPRSGGFIRRHARPRLYECGAAMAAGCDPGTTEVGGRHMSGPRGPVGDSSFRIVGPGV